MVIIFETEDKNERYCSFNSCCVPYISSWVEPLFWQSDTQTQEEYIEKNQHNYPDEYIDVLKQHPGCFEKYEQELDEKAAE